LGPGLRSAQPGRPKERRARPLPRRIEGETAPAAHFFSFGNWKPVNIERACLLMFSCICMNRSFDCSM